MLFNQTDWNTKGEVMNRTLLLGLAVLATALFVVGCDRHEPAGHSHHGDESAAESSQKAPDFTLTDHAGKTHTLSDYRGKTVVLEWTNPECPFVVRHYEAGTMTDLAAAYADKDVVWLAVNTTSHFDHAKNKAFADKYDLPYPVLDDRDGTVGRKYNVTRTPEMVIIDKSGAIAYYGAIDDDSRGNKEQIINYVKKALDELLTGNDVSMSKTAPYGCTIKWAPQPAES